ncbi:MAG: SRPBCC domain-containing protein [Thermoanaerobaculia bacterium]
MQRFRFLRLLHVSAVLLGALPLIAAPATTFTQGAVKVTETRSPAKRLYFEVVVPATPERVWAAFTTSEGLTTWLAPSAKVRLELGGEWQVSFGSGAPSGGNGSELAPDGDAVGQRDGAGVVSDGPAGPHHRRLPFRARRRETDAPPAGPDRLEGWGGVGQGL